MSLNKGSHNKYLLQYHLILVTKYRKSLFIKKHNINIGEK